MKYFSDQMCDWKKSDTKRKETKETDRYKKTIDCVLLMSCFFYPKPAGRQKINVSKYKLYITSNFRFYNSMAILYDTL